MDRRSFLKTSAMGGTAAAATTLAAPAYATGKRTLTMVTSWPRGFAVLDDAASYLEKFTNEMSDGNLTIDKKAPGELVGALEVFDAVSSGQADMYHSADYYFIGQHPAYAYFTAVPFGGTAQEVINWYEHGGGQELHDELGEIFNLKGLLSGNSGSQSGGWFRNEINSAADFNGLKFRMPGLGRQSFGQIGRFCSKYPRRRTVPSIVFRCFGRPRVGWPNGRRTRRLPRSCKSLLHSWFPRARFRFGVFRQLGRLE